jgi:hypothetical protein
MTLQDDVTQMDEKRRAERAARRAKYDRERKRQTERHPCPECGELCWGKRCQACWARGTRAEAEVRWAQVRELRELGLGQTQIAERLGITPASAKGLVLSASARGFDMPVGDERPRPRGAESMTDRIKYAQARLKA